MYRAAKSCHAALHVSELPARRGAWDRIGDVMPGPEQGAGGQVQVGGKMHGGREWDFVFDVDVEDGQPVKRLPYNRHENPYDAADRCWAHQTHLSSPDGVRAASRQGLSGISGCARQAVFCVRCS